MVGRDPVGLEQYMVDIVFGKKEFALNKVSEFQLVLLVSAAPETEDILVPPADPAVDLLQRQVPAGRPFAVMAKFAFSAFCLSRRAARSSSEQKHG